MKTNLVFFVIFIYSSIVNAGFTKNKDDLNKFIYQGENFNKKEFVINGFTSIENIDKYSTDALLTDNELTAIDHPLEIEIEHIQAIQVFNSSQYPYNQLIAFLVRTRDDRILLHIQIAKSVSSVEATPINFLLASLTSTRAYFFDGSATSNVPAVFDFGNARVAQSNAQALKAVRHQRFLYGQQYNFKRPCLMGSNCLFQDL